MNALKDGDKVKITNNLDLCGERCTNRGCPVRCNQDDTFILKKVKDSYLSFYLVKGESKSGCHFNLDEVRKANVWIKMK